jgi:peptide/nickel transport system permease protein
MAITTDVLRDRFVRLPANFLSFLRRLPPYPSALLGFIIVLLYAVAALTAPWIVPHDPFHGDLRLRLMPPAWMAGGSLSYLLGADELGRDILSRIIYGGRISLFLGFLSVVISAFIGSLLGSLAGFYRGRLDGLVSRLADLLLAFPYLIFALFVMAMIGPGMMNLVFALTFKGWVEFFRLARGDVMAEKTKDYVEAARAIGKSNFRIILSEILPNIVHSVLVLAILRMGYFIVLEASLSFLGLGIQPPIPAWGSMVNAGRSHIISAWWASTFPGLAIVGLVLPLNLLGEGLRDILDPRLRGGGKAE